MKTVKFLLITSVAIIFLFFTDQSFAKDKAVFLFFPTTPKALPGQNISITITVDSSVPVNAVQLKLVYPEKKFKFLSVNYANTKFSIQAQETFAPGSVTLVRGNVEPRLGKNLLATLLFETLASGDISDFTYSPEVSLVMSSNKNENILVGSEATTVKPPVPTKPSILSKIFTQPKSDKTTQTFWEFLKSSIYNILPPSIKN